MLTILSFLFALISRKRIELKFMISEAIKAISLYALKPSLPASKASLGSKNFIPSSQFVYSLCER